MTRINVVPPEELSNKHLLAEYRELPRIFTNVRKCLAKGMKISDIDIPPEYVLGCGHMKFFYNKLSFLYKRQIGLVRELKNRGFKLSWEAADILDRQIPMVWYNDWVPDEKALSLNRQRIKERTK